MKSKRDVHIMKTTKASTRQNHGNHENFEIFEIWNNDEIFEIWKKKLGETHKKLSRAKFK